MDKTAQKRTLRNKLNEFGHLNGRAAESFFNPEFKNVMDKLRKETDDPIRAIVTGEKIGDASAPDDAVSLKKLLSDARSNINRREYMKAVADLGRFHSKMHAVHDIIKHFDNNLTGAHEKFLFKDLDDSNKQHLHNLKTKFETKASKNNDLVKAAFIGGLTDVLTNIGTSRGRSLASWEKRYPKQTKKLKEDSKRIIDKADSVYAKTISALKEMASHRGDRKVDDYIASASKISNEYVVFDKMFRDFYEQNVKKFLQNQQLIAELPKTQEPIPGPDMGNISPSIVKVNESPKTVNQPPMQEVLAPEKEYSSVKSNESIPVTLRELGKFEENGSGQISDVEKKTLNKKQAPEVTIVDPVVSVAPATIALSPAPAATGAGQAPTPASSNQIKSTEPSAGVRKEKTLTDRNPGSNIVDEENEAMDHIKMASKHSGFYQTLESMSNEHPSILKLYISKYAASIKNSDPQTSSNLISIAQRI